jgi:hypothetical protein
MTPLKTDTLERLRKKHATIRYLAYAVVDAPDGLELRYTFELDPGILFTPRIEIPTKSRSTDRLTHRLAFLIGMVELVSYWKAACPGRIEIPAGSLDDRELIFWETVIRQGLGEFFYLNSISPTIDFVIESSGPELQAVTPIDALPAVPDSKLVLIGGGKDSIVSLELLSALHQYSPNLLHTFAVNPIPASLHAVETARLQPPLVARRVIDPNLLELNRQGYLNGHTPFSALLAFVSTLVAYQNGIESVVASNESSASEGNVEHDGVVVNHQYSKSFAFELLFRDYLQRLQLPVNYYSLLRPLNELQICALFSGFPEQHRVFRSCNRAQTLKARSEKPSEHLREGWCAQCPKCIFTYLCVRCFLSQEQLVSIFGTDPSHTKDFTSTAQALAGLSAHKPFECVGTFEEVRACLGYLLHSGKLTSDSSAELTKLAAAIDASSPPSLRTLLSHWNPDHRIPNSLAQLLHTQIASAAEKLQW